MTRGVYIGLGANQGDGPANLLAAWRRLDATPGVTALRISSPWRTSPVDMESPAWFTNAAGELATRLAPEELLTALLDIERAMGRDRDQGRDRCIDLDILLYGELCMTSNRLTIPHPRLGERLFALEPLAELAPGLRVPPAGATVSELLARRRRQPLGQRAIRRHWPGGHTS